MIKQYRNAECSCGSGKKAKKCCMLERKKTVELIKDFRKLSQSQASVAFCEIRAAIGGSLKYQEAEESAIGPPRWATWVLLAVMIGSFTSALFIAIWR